MLRAVETFWEIFRICKTLGFLQHSWRLRIWDSEEKPFTFRLKLPANYRIDPHVHPAYERVTVLSGTLHFAHGEAFDRAKTTALPAGGVAIMPPGAPMFGYTEEETIIQLHGEGPWGIKYLNPEHDPRN
jgi:hypothetical protein